MGRFFPCLAAAILNGCALQFFREPMKIGNGPLLSSYMFIFTTFLLLWSVRLYPSNIRKIGKLQFIVEFLIAEFLMEDIIIDFWFPLEKFVLDCLPAIAQNIEDWVSNDGNWSVEPLTDFLKDESCGFYVSYAMSTFFLLATLHASRIIDWRILTQEGPGCFIKDVIHRFKLGKRRLLRRFGFGKKKVKINENRNTAHLCGPSNRKKSSHSPCKKSPSAGDYCSNFCGNKPKRKKACTSKKELAKHSHYCPLHNPCGKDDVIDLSDCESSYDEFDENLSDLDCSL